MNISHLYPWFRLDPLSGFVAGSIVLFSALILVYSFRFMRARGGLVQYYTYIILTAIASLSVVLSNNLLVLLTSWGFLGLTLYLLINMGTKESSKVAKKTFIIVGGTDALMLLGIALIYSLAGTFQIDQVSISLAS
ncbi:MAG: proton-conducting transporter membrane subunit, partial [Candidatus Omnitrophica bacterium]|nr:proton-conducting transporter membrane subunit [Candidatus Omnitrophota bacterium]